jgi:hypothetical protein
MAVIVADLQLFHSLPALDPDPKLQAYLDFATRQVKRDGITESHADFPDLVIFCASSILEKKGIISGAISAKTIADISTTFKNSPDETIESWKDAYTSLLASVRGFGHRVV